MDTLCSHFVLTLTLRQAGRFNLRRDCNNLLALTARHLAWPPAVLARLRRYLALRCKAHDAWRGHEALKRMPTAPPDPTLSDVLKNGLKLGLDRPATLVDLKTSDLDRDFERHSNALHQLPRGE